MKVEVDAHLLHSGADMTGDAGRLVDASADHLDQAHLPVGMFGDFPAADAFHADVSRRHAADVARLRSYREVLVDVGDKAHAAALAFVRTDDANAVVIGATGEADF